MADGMIARMTSRPIVRVLAFLLPLIAGGIAPADEDTSPTPPGFWTEDELNRIDRGLEAINADRKDLGFHKRPIDDPFRRPVVDRALDDPLSMGAEAQAWDDVVRKGDVEALLERCLLRCGLRKKSTLNAGANQKDAVEHLPEEAANAYWGLLLDCLWARNATRAGLTGGPKDVLPLLSKAFAATLAEASPAAPKTDLSDEDFLAQIQTLQRYRLLFGAVPLLHSVVAFVDVMRGAKQDRTWQGSVRLNDEFGGIVMAGYGDDVHEEGDDVALVIDLGGNDTWIRGASAGPKRPVCVCLDLDGDDRYVGRKDFSFGGALGGVAIQWDCGGNDLYDAGHCSLGAGILGVGILVDEGGDDVYRSKDFGQGAGAFGVGILLDKAGNDLRHVDLYGQGYGSTWGCGVLADLAGHDVYDAGGAHSDAPLHRDRTLSLSQGFGFGMRPDASGGVGVLVDVAGNDRYSADIFGQGCSYWFALGLLIDDDGNDTYTLGHYGQGSGIHLSAAMLLDRAGQDLYFDEYGVGIGGAHDLAAGILLDRAGDDHYVGSGGSQGGALTNSVALLLDDSGDDEYTAVRIGASHGAATPARDTGGIGLLLDAGGKDVFSEVERQGKVWLSGSFGAGFDDPVPPEAAKPPDPMGAAITEAEAKARVDKDGTVAGPDGKPVDDLDKLWDIAKRWQVGDERVIGPIARARLVALGDKALDRAIERLGSKDGLELECVQAILSAFPKERSVPRLLDASRSKDPNTRRSAARFLGALGAAEAEARLVELLSDEEVRLQAVRALGALKKAPPAILPLLRSPKELEGVAAAACLGAVGDDASIDALVSALSPEVPYLVRVAAETRLAALGERAVPALSRAAKAEGLVRVRRSALRALGATKAASATDAIRDALTDSESWVRFTAVAAARNLVKDVPGEPTRALADALSVALAAEKDPLVLRLK